MTLQSVVHVKKRICALSDWGKAVPEVLQAQSWGKNLVAVRL